MLFEVVLKARELGVRELLLFSTLNSQVAS
jgi:hypothetical protein